MLKDRQQKNGPKKAEPRGAAGTTGTSAGSGTKSTTKSLTKPLTGGRTPGPQAPVAGPVNPASAQRGPAERGILPNYSWTHPVTGQTMDLGHPSTQLQFTGKNDAITQRLRNI
jgi:hypothetical protein